MLPAIYNSVLHIYWEFNFPTFEFKESPRRWEFCREGKFHFIKNIVSNIIYDIENIVRNIFYDVDNSVWNIFYDIENIVINTFHNISNYILLQFMIRGVVPPPPQIKVANCGKGYPLIT